MSTGVHQRPRRGRAVRRLVAPALVIALGVAIVAWGWHRTPQAAPPTTGAAVVPLDRVSLVCPATSSARVPGSRTDVSVVSLPEAAQVPGGRVSARVLPGGPALPGLEITAGPGHARAALSAADAAVVAVNGQAALAPGLGAFAAATASRQAGGGLTVTGCLGATRSWWFVGAGATVTHTSAVVVTNPDPTEAIATIDVLSGEGPLVTVGTQGLVIPPGDSVSVALSEVAAGREELAVHVEASQGRVVAGVLDSWRGAVSADGTEWLPSLSVPAGDVTVSGVPAAGRRTLLVVNPGQRGALVSVSVSDADGTFQSQDVREVQVAAGSVASVDLPETLGSGPLTLRLSSPTPVTAAVRDRATGDVAYAGTPALLDGPTAAPAASGLPELVVSGADPRQGAVAVLETYNADSDLLGSSEVQIPAGTTQSQSPPLRDSARQEAAYVVVRPQGEGVRASAVYSSDGGISVLPLTTPAQVTLAPLVSGRE